MAVILSGVFVFWIGIGSIKTSILRIIKPFIPRIIKTFTLTGILDRITNKTPIIVIIIKQDRFFLTNIRIYIVCIRKLYDFSKEINVDRE